ncbi:MAG: STAS domain-containing protein [Ilumatobacter sp.]
MITFVHNGNAADDSHNGRERHLRRISDSPATETTSRAAHSETVVLPARFDVHEVETVAASATSPSVVIDASAVEMIDHAALDSLVELTRSAAVEIVEASTAFRATVHFTGNDHLARRISASAEAELALDAEAA